MASSGSLVYLGQLLIDYYKKDTLHDQDADPGCVAPSESPSLSDLCLLLTSRVL